MTNYDIIGKRVDSIACGKCGTVMDTRDAEPFSIVQCPQCGTQQAVPKKLGDFLLLQFLGKGGMGAVFQGYDTKLGRQVAIKVLGKVLGDNPSAMDNFLREARAAAQINSPYVVQIFQVGEERNKPFIVMELINGGQLDKMIEHRPLPELRALEVCRDAAMGLQSAQEIGLFHGDIKPENILFDQHQTAKIADFGLAQFLQRGQDSRPGEIWGTPYYIAPEKARRQQEDYRSDIYSLGATLFHALTGQPPFEGETAADVVLARLKHYAPSILDINPSLHEITAKLVARMLEPDPAMRYPNYTSLLSDLDSVIQVVKRDPPLQPGKPRKKKGLGLLVLLLLLLLAGGLGAYFYLGREKNLFTEEQQGQLAQHVNVWTRNIYRFEPAALHTLNDSLQRLSATLPADHLGKKWLPLLGSTAQLLALSTNEAATSLAPLLQTNLPALVDGKPNRALMPLRLAEYLTGTNLVFSPGPERWPPWYGDLAQYVAACKLLAQADYTRAHTHLTTYAAARNRDEDNAWPYLFQQAASMLADQINKWNARQDLLDKFIARGNLDKAAERLTGYESGNPPVFMAYIESNRARLGTQDIAAPKPEPTEPNDDAVRRAEEESRKQREVAARDALKQREEEERQRRLREEAGRVAKARQQQQAREADTGEIRAAAVAIAPLIVQRNYAQASQTLQSQLAELTTQDGQRDGRELVTAIAGMEIMDQTILSELGTVPLPAAVNKMLGGVPKRADRNGILITLTHGETLKPWDQVGNPLYIKLAETILEKAKLSQESRAEQYMALTLFCKAIQAPDSWVTRYAGLATEASPDIRVELDRYLNLMSENP